MDCHRPTGTGRDVRDPLCFAADHPTESKRKIVNRVMPFYPQMARVMGLSGVVKIEAIVGNDGNPKLVDVRGGNPVLVQAAVDTVCRGR